jgi:hypothetical protein
LIHRWKPCSRSTLRAIRNENGDSECKANAIRNSLSKSQKSRVFHHFSSATWRSRIPRMLPFGNVRRKGHAVPPCQSCKTPSCLGDSNKCSGDRVRESLK